VPAKGRTDVQCPHCGNIQLEPELAKSTYRKRLVLSYNEAAEQKISPPAMVVHELLLHLHWLAESQTEHWPGGHSPEHYANVLAGLLGRQCFFGPRRAARGDNNQHTLT
jgi:hypothetical protein